MEPTSRESSTCNVDLIEGTGLTIGELRSVARRQLVGSVVVAIIILASVGLAAMRPAVKDAPVYSTAHRGVQQPTFDISSERTATAFKRKVETP